MLLYSGLNIFFFVFHSLVILFNLFGWIWRKTRRANLVLLLLTAFSWFFLGIWYGFGFCPCTEWHWQVRMKLGIYDNSHSYTKFLVDTLTGGNINATLIDIIAVVCLAAAFILSIGTNVYDWKKRGREGKFKRSSIRCPLE